MRTTEEVSLDEKAYRLTELNLKRAPKYEERRYQIILVNRHDRLAAWWYDLGPSWMFTANQFTFPLLWQHSVAQAREMADEKRERDTFVRLLAEKQAESTMVEDWLEQQDERRKIIHNRSVFGPGGHKQRDGFPRAAVLAARRERNSA